MALPLLPSNFAGIAGVMMSSSAAQLAVDVADPHLALTEDRCGMTATARRGDGGRAHPSHGSDDR
jgi:hypothetical protein